MRRRAFEILFGVLAAAAVGAAQHGGDGIEGVVAAPDGARLPNVRVTTVDLGTGVSRETASNHEGWYRIVGLPPGEYELVAQHPGFETQRHRLRVPIGGLTRVDVTMTVGSFASTVEITAEKPTISALSRQLPLFNDAIQVVALLPGAVPGDSMFAPGRRDRGTISSCGNEWTTPNPGWGTPGQQYLSVSGASVAENVVQLNGLNITDFSQGLGSSAVPIQFVEEARVASGGLGVDAAHGTGAVIDMVTRRGTNRLGGDVTAYWEPAELQEQEPNTHTSLNQHEQREALDVSGSLGGPLVRDRVFFFLFASYLEDRYSELTDEWGVRYEFSAPYVGARIDWNIAQPHRVEGSWFHDSSEVRKFRFAYDPSARLESDHLPGSDHRGGSNFNLGYVGVLRDNLLVTAQVGQNNYDRSAWSEGDECPVAYEADKYGENLWWYEPIGCWVNENIGSWVDTRTSFRLDTDWLLENHVVRAGFDVERNTPDSLERWSGGVRYITGPNGGMFPELADDVMLVQTENRWLGGDFLNTVGAAYVQDRWTLSSNLTVSAGVRWERQEGRNGLGETFLRAHDGLAPRLGVSWDPGGEGRSQVFGSYGLYFMPLPAALSVRFGAAEYHTVTVNVLDGDVLTDGSPEGLGELLYEDVSANGVVRDPREVAALDIAPASQHELIVGYQRVVGEYWRVGLRGVARRLDEAIEDFTINLGIENTYGGHLVDPQVRIGNPGSDFDGYADLDGDGALETVSLSAAVLGYPAPARDYYALEVSFDRRFANRWMLQGSYTWSHLFGNYEGLTNSDFAARISSWDGMTPTFDWPGTMEFASGDLPNDRRHAVKLYGTYAASWGLNVGGVFFFHTGRPVNSFGIHPDDAWRLNYGSRAFYTAGVPRPRGCCGRTDDVWSLDLMLGYTFSAAGVEWRLRADVFNLFDNAASTAVDEIGEYFVRVPNANHGMPVYYQPPRSVRLGFAVSF